MIMRRGFRADALRVHGLLLAMHNVVVDAILDIGGMVVDAVQTLVISLVLGEEQFRSALAAELALTMVNFMNPIQAMTRTSPYRSR
jgi:hypothetical protein